MNFGIHLSLCDRATERCCQDEVNWSTGELVNREVGRRVGEKGRGQESQ